ncbi:dihydrolipoamide acetyltransferase component of pyruvate dehydrogenase complex [Planomonospora parontospora subsp. parontospora]|uniref:Dihydrolipoamide acetyltransferase component of pyruvate dehydrogenase complex n=2 Tax=Planomonospora parontospora TaxID=58119 RepID=A0AA37F437_9ACTN|nr:2-oxo acid dehydrogenase subunit E2 [Planomonospora parontospora]GGK63063.1 dihydrolipoamide acetyltransferase component of pyruvate dehydrogenase complex [Planomonospora parontospora]GII08256.1 dihydrolipoamide acetyltransferase component of pyruvate dehydrogenase complex [Planomonospora parontospora subsp. parontospora]
MTDIPVPKLNNNDSVYLLTAWTVKDGEAVRAGEPIAELETSKAVEELTAPQDGVLRHLLPEGAECAPGQVIARLGADGDAPDPGPEAGTGAQTGTEAGAQTGTGAETGTEAGAPVITAPARLFMDEHGISVEQVAALGVKVVRRSDLERLLPAAGAVPRPASVLAAAPEPPVPASGAEAADTETTGPETAAERDGGEGTGLVELSRAQRRVAEVVERSHREIPAAFTAMRVDVTEALAFARQETRRLRALIGLPELLVQATGGLLDRFPLCFASPAGAHRARLPAAGVGVGVTMDVGRGMVVPVVKDAGGRPLAEIARDLMRLRQAALNGSFREDDLRGGSIMVTLHTEEAVVTAVPVVFPGQTCALSLTAPRPEVVETAEGVFTTRRVVSLGLAYDHRFVNGREAAEFLGALRSALESPGSED